jgi:hypothetical protein
MKAKLFLMVAVCLTICSLGVVLQWQYGIFARYNYFTALRDKHQGKLQLLTYGKELITNKQREIVAHQFGFEVNVIAGCIISDADKNGADLYNSVMNKAITSKLGKNWEARYETQVDSLFRDQSDIRIYDAVMKVPDVTEYMHKGDSVKPGSVFIKVVKLSPKDTIHPNAMLCVKSKTGNSIIEYYKVDPYTLTVGRILY